MEKLINWQEFEPLDEAARRVALTAVGEMAVKETAGHLQDAEISSDWNDMASAEEEHTLELRVRDRERKLLHKIRESLRRIDEGSYGWCEETGEPIGIARLLARPTASLCLEAQERREQSKRRFGG